MQDGGRLREQQPGKLAGQTRRELARQPHKRTDEGTSLLGSSGANACGQRRHKFAIEKRLPAGEKRCSFDRHVGLATVVNGAPTSSHQQRIEPLYPTV